MAERGTWAIENWNGSSWVADGNIYRPNENTNIDFVSTQVKTRLADGSNAFINPETVYVKEPLKFTWLEIANSDSFVAKIKNYVINANYLRITTHLSETFTGRFVYITRVWLTSVSPDTFDIQTNFEVQV